MFRLSELAEAFYVFCVKSFIVIFNIYSEMVINTYLGFLIYIGHLLDSFSEIDFPS